MKTKKIAQYLILSLLWITLSPTQHSIAYQSPESKQFIDGFNAFHKNECQSAINILTLLLKQPDSRLRELTLAFLARAYIKNGSINEAERTINALEKEFPSGNLIKSIDRDLLRVAKENAAVKERLAKAQEKAEREMLAEKSAKDKRLAEEKRLSKEKLLADEKAELDRKERLKAEQIRIAREIAEKERLIKEQTELNRIAQEKTKKEIIALHKSEQQLNNHRALLLSAAATPDKVLYLPVSSFSINPAKQSAIPVIIKNPGSMPDRFTITSDMPASWKMQVILEGTQTDTTRELAPGASVTGRISVVAPQNIIDNQKFSIPIIVSSDLIKELKIAAELRLVASAPLVRAVVKRLSDTSEDSSRAQCLVSVLNVGSLPAEMLLVNITHSPDYEPVLHRSTSFAGSANGKLQLKPFSLASGELQEFLIEFTTKGRSRTKSEIDCAASVVSE